LWILMCSSLTTDCTAREPALGASRQLKLMKYTFELRAERYRVGLAGSFLRYIGKGICKYSERGFCKLCYVQDQLGWYREPFVPLWMNGFFDFLNTNFEEVLL